MSTQFLHVLRNLGSGIAANLAAENVRSRAGMSGRPRYIRGPRKDRPTALGDVEYYDPYFDEYYYADDYGYYDTANPPDFWDYSGGGGWGGGDNSTSGDDYWGNWTPTGDGGWFDADSGVYVDQYGGWFDVWNSGGGDGWRQDDNGEWIYTIDSSEPGTGINDGDLYNTLDWWSTLDTGVDETNVDDVLNNSDLLNTLDWWAYITGGGDAGGDLDVVKQKPPVNASKKDKLAWLKKLADAAKKQVASGQRPSSGGGGAGGAVGAKTAQPNAAGQCPAGYAKNAAGQCVQQSAKPAASAAGLFGNIDPIWLVGGAVLLVLLAKK